MPDSHHFPTGDMRTPGLVPPAKPFHSESVGFSIGGVCKHGRGWLVRRALLAADMMGLVLAFVAVEVVFGLSPAGPNLVSLPGEFLVFAVSLPGWLLVAKLQGLYDHDEERTNHSTADELTAVFYLVTSGVWLIAVVGWVSHWATVDPAKLVSFWAAAFLGVILGRLVARKWCRRRASYQQTTVIFGAGPVGRLLARKILSHPEYCLSVVGFVDVATDPNFAIDGVRLLGHPDEFAGIIQNFSVDRVIVSDSACAAEREIATVRTIRNLGVQVDLVPRMFDVVGPKSGIHTVEGLSLVGLPPTRIGRTSRSIKRIVDIAVAASALLATFPLIMFIAWRIRRDSGSPIIFRQERLGLKKEVFTILKFRTMTVGNNDEAHRAYVAAGGPMRSSASGIFKLDRSDVVTRPGRWLRRTSLDELPQLVNVLRGDMSIVGPRPCMRYELDEFEAHHYDRFNVKPGMTGFWQVTARAHATPAEARDMDAAYARDWSLGLDMWLMARTPLAVLRQRQATA